VPRRFLDRLSTTLRPRSVDTNLSAMLKDSRFRSAAPPLAIQVHTIGVEHEVSTGRRSVS
jgi:hypothetical protein